MTDVDRPSEFLPGIALLVAVAACAWLLATVVPVVNGVLLAVALGVVVGSVGAVPSSAMAGVDTHERWLAVGIVLVGTQLVLDTVVTAGPALLVLVFGMVVGTILLVELLARVVFGLSDELGTLLASGSAVCGVSAIVGVAGGIRASRETIAYAVGAILLFDAVTLLVYPVVGTLLGLPDDVFGVWAGVSMFSTGPAIAAAQAYSETAAGWAALTKLTRNTLLGIVVAAYATYYARKRSVAEVTSLRTIVDAVPRFVVGFFVAMVVANAGILSEGQLDILGRLSTAFFLVAFAGLGIEMDLAQLRSTGFRPVAAVAVAFLASSSVSLGLSLILFG